MASKTTPNPDDPKQISTDSKEIDISLQDIAANQISSIIDAVPKLSLESKKNYLLSQKKQSQLPYQLIKLLTRLSYWMND